MLNKFDFEGNNSEKELDGFYRQQYELASLPGCWRNSALNLKRAADYIFEISFNAAEKFHNKLLDNIASGGKFKKGSSPIFKEKELEWVWDQQLGRVYYMLIGLALENLLKGILCNDSQFLKKEKLNHDLVKYATKCGFSLNEDQKFMLKHLRKHIEWAGRYPIPKDIDGLRSKFTVGSGTNVKDACFTGYDLINQMFNDFLNEMTDADKKKYR